MDHPERVATGVGAAAPGPPEVVRSDPPQVDRVSELGLSVRGELAGVFDGTERVVAVVIQRPYLRRVYVP
jgi:hypothetical protein